MISYINVRLAQPPAAQPPAAQAPAAQAPALPWQCSGNSCAAAQEEEFNIDLIWPIPPPPPPVPIDFNIPMVIDLVYIFNS